MKTKPTKRKPKVPKAETFERLDTAVAQCQSRRRSIPAKEVDEMLEQQAKELRKEPTLYDQRVEALANVSFLNEACDTLADRLNTTQLELASERNRLKDLNRLLKEELQFDQVR